MSDSTATPEELKDSSDIETPTAKPEGSYVKFAMRNMVRKRGTSLKHFFITSFGLLALFVSLAYLTR